MSTRSDSTPTNLKPTYLYKLIPHTAPPPSPLPLSLPTSALDRSSGFVHLSTAAQVPGTLRFFFSDHPHVYLARIPYERVEGDVRWEDPKAEVCGVRGGEGVFPHLYNERVALGAGEIESVVRWESGVDGWEEAVRKGQDWLVY
ncbi:hypothetical protein PHLCEN_2v8018 [Hermanssonia centrifuga]|uniref:DUF952 domain-containing protein n=1 Tax=Hermanssonia centrifuga TaxID=98765 RepID=A0A2R6NUW0_9APHY|nr:hypothetical protein PHLCEN_2v8018 [Hermanssonia centrifuga]